MSELLFVIGPQRSGTTVTARVLSAHPDIAPGGVGFHPFNRWDIPFMAEVGGNPDQQPLIRALRLAAYEHPARYFLAKIALSVSAESLTWPRLLAQFPKSMAVLTDRHTGATATSWLGLQYLVPQRPTDTGGLRFLHSAWSDLHSQQILAVEDCYAGRTWRVTLAATCLDPAAELGPVFTRLGLSQPPAAAYSVVTRTP